MENEFVPYEIALTLKELGFDESCFAIYDNKQLKLLESIQRKNSTYQCVVTAPLYQQAFRWFRENHNLHGEISVDHRNKYFFMMCKFVNKKMIDIEDESEYCDTYEEAEKECLNKLIELCKKN